MINIWKLFAKAEKKPVLKQYLVKTRELRADEQTIFVLPSDVTEKAFVAFRKALDKAIKEKRIFIVNHPLQIIRVKNKKPMIIDKRSAAGKPAQHKQ